MPASAMDATEADVRRFQGLLNALHEQSTSSTDYVKQIRTTLNNDANLSKGVGLLNVKVHTLLSYIINLTQIVLQKLRGQSIKDAAAVDRLIELRVVAERIRPIEMKLQYQISKLLCSLSSEATTSKERDALSFRPHPQDMDVNDEDEDSDSDSNRKKKASKASDKYVPPKLIAAPYVEKSNKAEERLKRRLLKSSVMEDLQEQYFEAPQEIVGGQIVNRNRTAIAERKQKEYEEENFTRLRLPKGQQKDMRSADDTFGMADFFARPSSVQSKGTRKRKKKSRYGKKKTKRRR